VVRLSKRCDTSMCLLAVAAGPELNETTAIIEGVFKQHNFKTRESCEQ
jgi:hypothetical protein